MSDYDNTNKGSIWKNEKKEKETHPDFTGTANIDGVEFWVSAWKRKEGDNPKSPALRFSFKPKDEAKPEPKQTGKPSFDDLDSDLPF